MSTWLGNLITPVKNLLGNLVTSVKNLFSSKEAKKELLMDTFIIAPYIVSDILLYYASYLNFLASQASDPKHPEKEPWYYAAYCTGTVIISVALAPALFLAFSDTTARMLKIQDNAYRKLKAFIRKIVGLPGSLIKIGLGGISLRAILVSNHIAESYALLTACSIGVISLPALASFMWSDHNKATNKPGSNLIMEKQAFAYLTSACYAMDVGFVYLLSALKIPQNMGFMDHDLSQYKNNGEYAAYIVICTGAVIETLAVFLAFARLNANMFGLIYKEDGVEKGCWAAIENSWIKTAIGSIGVLFKLANTLASALHFLEDKIPPAASISAVTYSTIVGFLAQRSVLIIDPLADKEISQTDEESLLLIKDKSGTYEDTNLNKTSSKIVTAEEAIKTSNLPLSMFHHPATSSSYQADEPSLLHNTRSIIDTDQSIKNDTLIPANATMSAVKSFQNN